MSSQHEIETAARETACAEAWDAYVAARPDLPRDPIYERLFNAGFDRGWRAKEEK